MIDKSLTDTLEYTEEWERRVKIVGQDTTVDAFLSSNLKRISRFLRSAERVREVRALGLRSPVKPRISHAASAAEREDEESWVSRGALSRFVQGDGDVIATVKELVQRGDPKGVYLELDHFDPDKHTIRNTYLYEGTKKEDITRKVTILFDLDVKCTDRNSNNAEFDRVESKARVVFDTLCKLVGSSSVAFGCSGNGYHVHTAVDLENNDETDVLVSETLSFAGALWSDHYSNPPILVDQAVGGSGRIATAYGIKRHKFDGTPDAPCRPTWIATPEEVVPLNLSQVQALRQGLYDLLTPDQIQSLEPVTTDDMSLALGPAIRDRLEVSTDPFQAMIESLSMADVFDRMDLPKDRCIGCGRLRTDGYGKIIPKTSPKNKLGIDFFKCHSGTCKAAGKGNGKGLWTNAHAARDHFHLKSLRSACERIAALLDLPIPPRTKPVKPALPPAPDKKSVEYAAWKRDADAKKTVYAEQVTAWREVESRFTNIQAERAENAVLQVGDEVEIANLVSDTLPQGSVFTRNSCYVPTQGGLWDKLPKHQTFNTILDYSGSFVRKGQGGYQLQMSYSKAEGAHKILQSRRNSEGFFETAPQGVAVQNGFLALDPFTKSWRLEPLSINHKATYALAAKWKPNTPCPPKLKVFLHDMFAGRGCEEKIDLARRFIGSALLGQATTIGKILMLVGRHGNDGKSTLLKLISSMVPAKVVCHIPPAKFSKDMFAVTTLEGKLFNIVFDVPDGEHISDTGLLKAAATGDPLEARPMKAAYYSFIPVAAWILAMNAVPPHNDSSGGLRRRGLILRCNNPCPEDKINLNLLNELKGETEEALNWFLQGGLDQFTEGTPLRSKDSDDEAADWCAHADSNAGFCDEILEPSSTEPTHAGDIYDAYKSWCKTNGHQPKNSNRFFVYLKTLGHESKRTSSGVIYYVRLKDAKEWS